MQKLLSILALLLLATSIHAQTTNTWPWPASGQVGIGTKASPPGLPLNLLHLHDRDSTPADTMAAIRLSDGDSTTTPVFGVLGIMPHPFNRTYTSLSHGQDLVLHEHSQGDMIFSNFQSFSATHPFGAIRFSTTPDPATLPLFPPIAGPDLERVTILGNGNVGIDLPPDTGLAPGLGTPRDQLQIGGGTVPYPGNTWVTPGLTLYGGNRFENLPKVGGGTFPGDWRYIAFNEFNDHLGDGFSRVAATSSSSISFSENYGGTLDFSYFPYDTSKTWLQQDTAFVNNVTMELRGNEGMHLWYYKNDSDQYHPLFEIWRPGFVPSYLSIRNDSGLCMVRTPVYIGGGLGWKVPNFTNFGAVRPDIGDTHTWMLAVDGPALFKEIFVLDSTWADVVFDPNYILPPLEVVEKFMKTYHHLPDLPPASALAKTGVPIERTEQQLTKQLEEAMLYLGQLHDEVKELKSEVEELKNQKEK